MLRKLRPLLARRALFTNIGTARCTAQPSSDRSLGSFETFSSTASHADSSQLASTAAAKDPPPEYSFSIRPKEASPPLNTQLRQSLRAWSVQNERVKASESPTDIPYEGRITQLPDTIFIGKENSVTNDDGEIFESEIDEEAVYSTSPLQPGDLLYLPSKVAGYGDAIYLGSIGLQSLLLTSSGKWSAESIAVRRRGVTVKYGYVVPNVLTPEEVESLRTHLPKHDVIRSVRPGSPPSVVDVAGRLPDHIIRPALDRLREIEREMLKFKRDYKLQLDQMYNLVASPDQWLRLSLKDLPSVVLGIHHDSMTEVARASFANHASSCHPLIIPFISAKTLQFLVGPKSLANEMALARQWAREYQEAAAQSALGKDVSKLLAANPLSAFISKAQRIIKKSRSLRAVTWMNVLVPSHGSQHPVVPEKVPTGETFTDDDKVIINYLWQTSIRRPTTRHTEPQSALIVRAVGAYPRTELSFSATRLLLQELGCVDPWTNTEETVLPLPETRAAGTVLKELSSQAVESVGNMTDPVSMTTTFPDSMARLREDWTKTEVFCIDSRAVKSAEDAISVEPAGEMKDAYWLHVHVSHPAAFLDFDHPIVKLARKKGGSYFDNELLNQASLMIQLEAARQFSLKQGSPALTVSTLLSTDGRVHDIKVAPTRLHNFIQLDPQAVRHVLGFGEEEPYSFLVVGKVPKPTELRDCDAGQLPKAEKYRPQLELIYRLVTARRELRPQELETPASYVKTSVKQHAAIVSPRNHSVNREHESYHWKGDPGIVLKGERRIRLEETAQENRADDIVAQTVRLACESIGKWLAERRIPAVYLGSTTAPAFSLEKLNNHSPKDQVLLPLFSRNTTPIPLFPHNMKQYAMFSSPIREYLDLLNQFQVTAYLKAQAQNLVKAGEPIANESLLPFSLSDIEDYISEDAGAGDIVEQTPRVITRYWTCFALFRAFHLGEARLPEVLEVLITRPYMRNADGTVRKASGLLVPWGADVSLEETPEEFEMKAKYRSFVPVKISSVEPMRKVVHARAIGPSTNEQQFTDPIHAFTEENFLTERARQGSCSSTKLPQAG